LDGFSHTKRKYVWLSDSAGLKQDRDKAKYEKAVKLAKEIEKIKDRIVKDMKSKEPKISRIATVCYLIYRTAMRVGDEKDPEEADTVGATTLRKEHIKITTNTIEFDFLGKDSVRWQETVVAEGHDKQFQENLKKLIEKKNQKMRFLMTLLQDMLMCIIRVL
jgi:Topoisomerase IB